jgi:phosphinothricin acetyltransferase
MPVPVPVEPESIAPTPTQIPAPAARPGLRGGRRAGVGRGLYTALLDLLSAQGYANAFAGVALPNDASVGLHEATGFDLVGVYRSVGYKLGTWWDVAWWQRRLGTAAVPPPPIALVEVHTDRVDRALTDGAAQINY